MRLAVYYRVSTTKQDIDMQRHDVKRHIEQHWPTATVVEYIDLAKSGKDDARVQFNLMLAHAEQKKFDVLVCYRLDRISRSANTALRTILRLEALGIGFVATSQPVLNLGPGVPFRKMILAAFAEIAEIEREMIVSRINSGLAAAKERGVKLGRPIKYDSLDLSASIVELATQGLTLREIATAAGVSHVYVHTHLKKLGIPTTRGEKRWQDQKIVLQDTAEPDSFGTESGVTAPSAIPPPKSH